MEKVSMRNCEITIRYKNGAFVYKDENGNDGNQEAHLVAADTIRWKLVGYGAKVSIDFNSGDPFTPPTQKFTAATGQWTNTGTFNNSHHKLYKYVVTAYDAQGSVLHSEDPQVEFDDGSDNQPPPLQSSSFPDPDKVAQAAEGAWEKLFDKLRTVQSAKSTTGIRFYPHGINNIQVTVGFSGVTITVQVSGPDHE